MGLDLYHFRANGDHRGHPITIDPAIRGAAQLKQKLHWCLETIDMERVDWDATFAAQGLARADYRIGPSTVRYESDTEIETGVFAFRRKSWFGSAPKCVVFMNSTTMEEIEITYVSKGYRPAVFRGPLATHMVPEATVFAEQAGYQRKSVDGPFFKEFQSNEFVVDPARIRRIHELTIEEAKADFKAQFLDNWDERSSFAAVSW